MNESRFASTVIATAAAAALLCAQAAHAQSSLKAVDARIVNTPSQPVPVTVIASGTPAPTVHCRLTLVRASGNSPITSNSFGHPFRDVICPTGVSRLDVQRVVLSSSSMPHHRVHLALTDSSAVPGITIAALSNGTPDVALARPVRIDLTVQTFPPYLLVEQLCSSGIAGINADCAGEVVLIGTAAN